MTAQDLQAAFRKLGPCRTARVLLWLAAIGLAAYCAFGAKPWEIDIATRAAIGQKIPLDDFVAEGMWWGAAGNLLAVLALLFTADLWSVPLPCPTGHERRGRAPAWLLAGLVAAVALAAFYRVPRLSHSLWNDEEYTLRRYVHGSHEVQPDGSLRFKPVEWRTTFFYNRGANNHIPFSAAAKLCLAATGRDGSGPVSEIPLRAPALLAGLLSVFLAGMVLAALERPGAGLLAALLLAIHPWHIRYSVEARGYAFMLCFSLLAVWLLIHALRRLHWPWWLGYAASQFLYLYCFPGTIYLALAVNLVALRAVFVLHQDWRMRHLGLMRLFIAGVLGAMLFFPLIGPSLHQIRLYLERDIAKGAMDASWFFDIWSHFAAGIRWQLKDPGNPLALGLRQLLELEPWTHAVFFGLLPALLVAGLIAAARLGPPARIALLAPIGAALLAFAHTSLTGNFLFSWYLVFALPAFVMAAACGSQTIAFWSPASTRGLVWPITAAAVLAAYAAATARPRELVTRHDRQPIRQAIEAIRHDAAPFAPEGARVVTMAFGTSCRQLQSYDPRILALDEKDDRENVRQLIQTAREASANGRPLRVLLGGRRKAMEANPALLALVDRADLFRPVARIPGLEEWFSFEAYEFTGDLPALEQTAR